MTGSTEVDSEIIHEVAQEYNFGAGMLKGLLQSEHLGEYADDSEEVRAVEEAYRRQRKRQQ